MRLRSFRKENNNYIDKILNIHYVHGDAFHIEFWSKRVWGEEGVTSNAISNRREGMTSKIIFEHYFQVCGFGVKHEFRDGGGDIISNIIDVIFLLNEWHVTIQGEGCISYYFLII